MLLAIPGAAAAGLLASLGESLAGKVVIDATNDVQGAGRLHALDELAEGAHPVRAFNTVGFETFADPTVDGVTADLFYAAEEGRGKDVAEILISDWACARCGSAAARRSTWSTRSPGSGSRSRSSESSAGGSHSRCWWSSSGLEEQRDGERAGVAARPRAASPT